ncbi:amidohydrolase family protein [Corallincola platygyrae]|uniref:Amidohydrolase family protein n=1 Tax=Corallincola platygyrae TaxID=1193278 RepID=A0ABW4XPF1_9GAMM
MKKLTNVLALLLSLSAVSGTNLQAHTQVPGAPQSQPILIQDGTVHTGDGEVLKGYDLLLENGVISQLEQQIPVPENAKVISAVGQSVYPTLIALDTTLGLLEIDAVRATDDEGEVGSINPNAQGYIAFNADSELLPPTRSNGIGYVQVAPKGGLLSGTSSLVHLDGWNNVDSLLIDDLGVHLRWPTIKLRQGWYVSQDPESQREDYAEDLAKLHKAFADAKRYKYAKEADQLAATDQRWEAMLPVLRGEQPIYIHADDIRDIVQAIAFAQRERLAMILVGGAQADQAINSLLRFNIPVIYTHSVAHPFTEDDGYDSAFSVPLKLQKAGVKYALAFHNEGTWDVRNLPFAAGQAVGFGLTKEQALTAITLTAAEILGVDEELGSLRPGKRASLVIAPGDILDYSGHPIKAMLIDGREVDLNNRQKQLYQKYQQKPAAK